MALTKVRGHPQEEISFEKASGFNWLMDIFYESNASISFLQINTLGTRK
jgi:hypothetical protein